MTESRIIRMELLAMVLSPGSVPRTDLRTSRIPNWLTFTAMGVATIYACLAGWRPGTLFSLSGLGTGLDSLFDLVFLGRHWSGRRQINGSNWRDCRSLWRIHILHF